MSATIQSMFSRIAGTYDEANHKLSFNKDVQWRKDSVKQLTQGGFKPKKVLDLCAGTGDFALAVKESLPETQVILADFAKPMLQLASDKVKGKPGLELLETDALKLPFQDMTFDAVVCGFGVRNLDNTEAALKQIARVLKPEGRVIILDFFRPTSPLSLLIYNFYVRTIVPLRGGAISKDKAAYEYLRDTAGKFMPVNELKALMEKCGFKDVAIESRTLGAAASVMGIRK